MDDDTGDQLPQQSPVGKNRLRGARRGGAGTLSSRPCAWCDRGSALSCKTCARRGGVGTLSHKTSARRGRVGTISRKTCARRGRVGAISRRSCALRGGAGCLLKEGRAPNPCGQRLILFPQDSKPVGTQLFPAAEVCLTGEEFLPGEKTGLIIFVGRAQEGLKMESLPLQLTDVFPLQLAGGPSLWRTEFLPLHVAGVASGPG